MRLTIRLDPLADADLIEAIQRLGIGQRGSVVKRWMYQGWSAEQWLMLERRIAALEDQLRQLSPATSLTQTPSSSWGAAEARSLMHAW